MANLGPESFKQNLLDAIKTNNLKNFNKILDEQRSLHNILSEIYDEICLKGTQPSKQLKTAIETYLIKARLFKKTTTKQICKVHEQIDFLLFLIGELNTHKQSHHGVFAFISRCIAANLQILKKQLNNTYCVLPWEEIEFCLVGFISRHDLTLIADVVLTREKILAHLNEFQGALRAEKIKFKKPKPKFNERFRNKDNILMIYRQFTTLYEDYDILRDVYSLKRMQKYLRVCLSCKKDSQIRQLVVERTLLVIGENLKSTPESPNLSPETAERILGVAPARLAQILTFLRNTPSYSNVLTKKLFLQENYSDISGGLKQIYVEIARVLYEKFGKIFADDKELKYPDNIFMYKKLANAQKLCDEIQNLIEISNYNFAGLTSVDDLDVTLEQLMTSYTIGGKKIDDKELSDNVKNIEKEMFSFKKTNVFNDDDDNARETIKRICLKIEAVFESENEKVDFNKTLAALEKLHFAKAKILEGKIYSQDEYKEIIKQFSDDVRKDLMELNPVYDLDEIKGVLEDVYDVYGKLIDVIVFDGIISVRTYRKILDMLCAPKNGDHLVEDFQKQIDNLTQLLEICNKSDDNEEVRRVATEALLLDLLEILTSTFNFIDDASYLDDAAPLLVGKNLRNYLVHGNPLIDTFPFNPRNSMEIHSKIFIETSLNFDVEASYGQTTNFTLKSAKEFYGKRLAFVENQAAMFEAARRGDVKNVEECVEKGADPSAFDVNAESGLKCAAKANNVELLKYFLDQNVEESVESLLESAAENGCESIVEYLLENNEEARECLRGVNKLLCLAVLNDQSSMVQFLLNLGCKVNTTTLHLAALKASTATADALIKHDASIALKDDCGEQALHAAARSGSWECAELFLEKGADAHLKNHEGFTALHLAAIYGHADFIDKLLINKQVYTDEDLYVALFLAAMYGHKNSVEILLLKHKTPTELENKPLTPLHAAAIFGHKNAVDVLLENGASLESVDFYSWTPLHYAAFKGWTDLIRPLFKAGLKTKKFHTALHLAAYSGNKETVEAVLECEKDVIDSEDVFGCTALYLAAFRGNADVVEILIKAGAKTEITLARANLLFNAQSWPPLLFIRRYVPSNVHECESVNNFLSYSQLLLQKLNYGVHTTVDFISQRSLTKILLGVSDRSFDVQIICKALEKQAAFMAVKSEYDFLSQEHHKLYAALEDGNNKIVKALQNNRVDVLDLVDYDSKTEAISVVHTILGQYMSPSIREYGSWYPKETLHCFYIAALQGHTDVVRVLFKYGVERHVRDKAVYYAAYGDDHNYMIEILMAEGANPNVIDDVCLTPLHVAAFKGSVRNAQTLIRYGANIHARTKDNTSVLEMAAMAEQTAILKVLLDNRDFSFLEKYTAFQTSVENGKEKSVQVFLKYGYGGRFKGEELLPPLYSAIFNGNQEILTHLLREGFNVDEKFRSDKVVSPLYLGINEETEDFIDEVLLKRCTFVNATLAKTLTPLTLAIVRDNFDVVGLLLKYGADPTKVNTQGYTELHIVAVCYHCSTLLPLLLPSRSDNVASCVNVKDDHGNSPLMWAVYKKLLTNVEVFISKGADVNQQNKHGTSPLHCAVHVQSIELVKLLIASGADVTLKNKEGKTAAEMAEGENMKTIVDYFRSLT